MRLTIIILLCCVTGVATSTATAGDGPVLTVTGTEIEPTVTSDPYGITSTTIHSDQEVQYCWTAEPGTSSSAVASYRYGWNLIDPADTEDPGWMIPVTPWDGTSVCSDARYFLQGAPNLVVEVRDEAGAVTRLTVQFQVIQVVPVERRSWTTVKSTFAH